jgi:hypothetical protein
LADDSINYSQSHIIKLNAPRSDSIHWKKCVIERNTGIEGHSGIYPADFDHDGDLDLAGWIYGEHKVRVYRNLLAEQGLDTFVFQTDLYGPSCGMSCLLWCGDLNRDGRPDIVVPGDTMGWFENQDSFRFVWHFIGVPGYGAPCCDCDDVDGDNAVDIVCGDQPLDLWRNDGNMNFSRERIANGKWWRVKLGDVTGDGYPDLLASDILYKNRGTNGRGIFDSSWSGRLGSADGIWIRDFDADGRRDLLLCKERDGAAIYWYWNEDNSGHNFDRRKVVRGSDAEPYTDGCIGEDIDGDNLPDVVGARSRVGFFRNTGSDFEEIVVDSNFPNSHWVYAAPLAGEHDLDIVAANGFEGLPVDSCTFTWWKNQIKNRFYPWGHLFSSVLDGDTDVVWQTLSWWAVRPVGTKLGFLARAGSTPDLSGVVWSDTFWAQTSDTTGWVDLAGHVSNGRYFQYQVWMSGSGDTSTPWVDWVRVNYDPDAPDVGVMDLWPSGPIDSGTVITPWVKVYDYFSRDLDSIPVICRIRDARWNVVYTDTLLLPRVTGHGLTTGTFTRQWIALPRGPYTTKCSTAFTGDTRTYNDVLTKNGVVLVHDMGAESILVPVDTVTTSTPVTPTVVIKNHGNTNESLYVRFWNSAGYRESTWVGSPPPDGGIATVGFPPWTPSDTGWVVNCCSTMLRTDTDSSNDKVTNGVEVVLLQVDVGVDSIIAPKGIVADESLVTPKAAFHNYGNTWQSFRAVFRIDSLSGGNVYRRFKNITLAAGAWVADTFLPSWRAALGEYTVSCSTQLFGDENPENDTCTESLHVVRSYDVGVTRILAPTGVVDSADTIQPEAVVYDTCAYAADFWAYFRIGTFYYDSLWVGNLPRGQRRTVTFPSWPDSLPRGTYAAKCSTGMPQDHNQANDTMSSRITVKVQDVSAIRIVSPPLRPDSVVFVGDQVTPKAWVHNPGTDLATFKVHFWVEGLYHDSCQETLNPGESVLVTFPRWTVQDAPGTYATACNTAWGMDRNPVNDTVKSSVVVLKQTLLIERDRVFKLVPDDTRDDTLVVTNTGMSPDTPDVDTTGPCRTGWQFWLLDSVGQTLGDLNGNGIPDLGNLPPGASAFFILRVYVPEKESGLVEDVMTTTAISSLDPRVYDRATLVCSVRVVPKFTFDGDRTDSVHSGDTARYELVLRNDGNYRDDYVLSRQSSCPNWTFNLPGGVGPVPAFGGEDTFYFLVTPPDNTPPGVTDLTIVTAQSGYNPTMTHGVLIRTTALGSLHTFKVEPDQTDKLHVGQTRAYSMYVETEGNVADYAELGFRSDRTDWGIALFGENGQPLPDSNRDGRVELGPIASNSQKHFILKVTAPDDIPANLAGPIETLTTCHIRVSGQSRFDGNRTDTARVTVQVIPGLAIHNCENPFSDRTEFVFSVPRGSKVRLYVYDQPGELVAKLIDNEFYDFGIHTFTWDGTNDKRKKLAPGTYHYLFELADQSKVDESDRILKKLIIR